MHLKPANREDRKYAGSTSQYILSDKTWNETKDSSEIKESAVLMTIDLWIP